MQVIISMKKSMPKDAYELFLIPSNKFSGKSYMSASPLPSVYPLPT